MTTLADLLMERFKVKTRAVENPQAVTSLGVAAQIIVANNPNRLAFIIINLSANTIYIGLTREVNATAGTEQGIRLDPNGGAYSAIWDEDFQMTGWAWWGISTGAASQIYSLEVVAE